MTPAFAEYVDGLAAENAKLRELVRLYADLFGSRYYDLIDTYTQDQDEQRAVDRIAELRRELKLDGDG
jgi:hypothetical protein